MNRIARINFSGISATFVAVVAASAILAGCGQAPAVKAAGVTTAGPPINPSLVSQNSGGLNAAYSITSLTAQQQAQITALLGNYTGTFAGYDANGNPVTQTYTLTLAKGTTPNIAGQTFASVTFTAGPGMNFTSLMATGQPMAGTAGGSGYCYEFVSSYQTVTPLDSNGQFMLNLQLCLNSANQFDATQSPYPISIVDISDFLSNSSTADDYNVVQFNGDFQKH